MNEPPICYNCKHKDDNSFNNRFTCAAFPKGIPEAIIDNVADHRKPFEGDNGIRFDAIDPAIAFPEFGPDIEGANA